MEGRNQASTAAGGVSRMKEDLENCTRDLLASFQPRPMIRAHTEGRKRPHVGVIGAGLAGLRCAEVLIEGGARVTVLEARDRIGGRIHQAKLLDQVVDMGPNWVHGTDDNPILKLAQETDTSLCAVADTMKVFEPSGTEMPEEFAAEGMETVWDLIGDAFKHSNEQCLGIDPSLSLKDYFYEKLAEGTLDKDQQKRVLLLAEMWGSFIGDSWDRQSLRWFWLEECLDGENLLVANNHASVLQHVAVKPLAYADVRLSTKVTSIETAGTNLRDPRVTVRSADGETFRFDEVVVAVPLGCLKQNRPTFSPPLPPRLQRAVRNASYSTLEKVYITFPTAFWDGPDTPSSPSTSPSAPRSFSYFLHLTTYVPAPQQSHTIELLSLSTPSLFGAHARPTLLVYTHDPLASHLSSLLANHSPGSAAYNSALDEFFRPYYSRLPFYNPSNPSCTPAGFLATDWRGDDLAGNGAYTNFKVAEDSSQGEQIRVDADVRAMRAGVPERGVWFAGEHTAPFVALGTTTGAYWSGEAVAGRVLAANGIMGVEGVEGVRNKL
ncbi:flavin-containing amine oxidase [Staphylotrichum tortipilum]|uniref:Flavin-containing amine oxidase n=1 Tax=Staphylotrichum tortipilum TaxID=2831512 RepID=A0AAN6RTL3_9PEZI|nr:flavin-containing amine oxidase [Staphylotrichum longicolle]